MILNLVQSLFCGKLRQPPEEQEQPQQILAVVDLVATAAAAAAPEDLTYVAPDDSDIVAAEEVGEVSRCWDIAREVAAENAEE